MKRLTLFILLAFLLAGTISKEYTMPTRMQDQAITRTNAPPTKKQAWSSAPSYGKPQPIPGWTSSLPGNFPGTPINYGPSMPPTRDIAAAAAGSGGGLEWTQYGIGAGASPGITRNQGAPQLALNSLTPFQPTGEPITTPAVSPEQQQYLDMWMAEQPGNAAYWATLDPEGQANLLAEIVKREGTGFDEDMTQALYERNLLRQRYVANQFSKMNPNINKTRVTGGKNANGQPASLGSNYSGSFSTDYSNPSGDRSAYQNWLNNLTNWNIG